MTCGCAAAGVAASAPSHAAAAQENSEARFIVRSRREKAIVACRNWRSAASRRLRAAQPWHSGRSRYFDQSARAPTELAIYAAEVRLIMAGLAFLGGLVRAAP